MALTFCVRRHPLMCLTSIALITGACHGSDGAAADLASRGKTSPVATQPVDSDPCAWLPVAEVERLLGPLGAKPTRVRNAEQFDEVDPQGSACSYQLRGHSEDSPAFIAIGVVLDGVSALEAGLGSTFTATGLAALGGADQRDTAMSTTGRWDWKSDLPSGALWAARQGHLAVMATVRARSLPNESVDSLAAAIIDRIPDLPFGERSAVAGPSSPDPCALLTQAEAEAVLGKLVVAPYRSRESTTIANANGTSCSFYTPNHHVLVVTPTREDGRMVFKMMSSMAQEITESLGVSAAGDTLNGAWDETARSIDGTLYFLKGDRMLEMKYRTANTDLAGALRLAAAALPRL
jgi:hypothetical protein